MLKLRTSSWETLDICLVLFGVFLPKVGALKDGVAKTHVKSGCYIALLIMVGCKSIPPNPKPKEITQ